MASNNNANDINTHNKKTLYLCRVLPLLRDFFHGFASVQSLSRVQPFMNPPTAVHQASVSITNSQSLLKLKFIALVMPSNHLILCRPLSSRLQSSPASESSNESVLRIRWSKYWSFSFNISPTNEHPRLITFREDGLVGSPCRPRDSQGSSPTPQFKSINSLALSFLYVNNP